MYASGSIIYKYGVSLLILWFGLVIICYGLGIDFSEVVFKIKSLLRRTIKEID